MSTVFPILLAVVLSAGAIIGVLLWKLKPQPDSNAEGLQRQIADLRAEAAKAVTERDAAGANLKDALGRLDKASTQVNEWQAKASEAERRAAASEAQKVAEQKRAQDALAQQDALSKQLSALQREYNQLIPVAKEAQANKVAAEVAKEKAEKQLAETEARYSALSEKYQSALKEAASAVKEVESLIARMGGMDSIISGLAEERTQLQQQLADALAKQKADEASAQQFQNIGQKVLKEAIEQAKADVTELTATLQKASGEELSKHSEAMSKTLEPLQSKLLEYDKAVAAMKADSHEIFGSLTSQIKGLQEAERDLHAQAKALTTALSEGPKVKGKYGEIVLKRLVEFAGMQPHCHYEEQASQDTQEGRRIPDLVITMPGNQKIVVDAKAVMSAFLDAQTVQTDADRTAHLQKHCKNVRARVNELAEKNYFAHYSTAVEATVLFIPGEHLYAAAVENDPDLTDYAMGRNVIVCGPNALLLLLKAATHVWKQASIEQEAKAVAQLGGDIYKYAQSFLSKYATVGDRIRSLTTAYNDARGTLEGRLLPSSRKMTEFQSLGLTGEVADLPELIDEVQSLRSAEGKKFLHYAPPELPFVEAK